MKFINISTFILQYQQYWQTIASLFSLQVVDGLVNLALKTFSFFHFVENTSAATSAKLLSLLSFLSDVNFHIGIQVSTQFSIKYRGPKFLVWHTNVIIINEASEGPLSLYISFGTVMSHDHYTNWMSVLYYESFIRHSSWIFFLCVFYASFIHFYAMERNIKCYV